MPQTVNGCGTYYLGKHKAFSRQALCRHCGRPATLTSYDTRLWGTLVYLPLIPWKKKHIVDQCSICTRHYAVDLAKWEAQRDAALGAAAAKFHTDPTPELAVQVHETLVGYLHFEKATEFRKLLAAQFSSHPATQEYLGRSAARLGHVEEALRYFEAAFRLQPDLPFARAAIATQRIREGFLDQARDLLDFLLKPGAAARHSLEPLFVLAEAFVTQRREREALPIYRHLTSELPAAAQDRKFRKKVRQAERALGEKTSILPAKKFRLFWGIGLRSVRPYATLLVILVVASFFWKSDKSQKRLLFVLNGYAAPLSVKIAGEPPLTIKAHNETWLELPEGDYQAKVSGPVTETIPFSIHSNHFARSGNPMWVLNPGGAELIQKSTVVYSNSAYDEAGSTQYLVGEHFMAFQDVFYRFTVAPETALINESSEVRVAVTRYAGSLNALHHYLLDKKAFATARHMAETRLTIDPQDTALLQSYLAAARNADDYRRNQEFLKAGLSVRPVVVPWHEVYQQLRKEHWQENIQRLEYDTLLAETPADPALLYLRGRISERPEEARDFYRRALAVDPNLPEVLLALAQQDIAKGDLSAALPRLEIAGQGHPDNPGIIGLRDELRFATGQMQILEDSIRRDRALHPFASGPVSKLAAVLIATGRKTEAHQEVRTFLNQLATKQPRSYNESAQFLQYTVQHLLGNFAEANRTLGKYSRPEIAELRFTLFLDQILPAEAMAIPGADKLLGDDPSLALAASLAWHLAGDPAKAAAARATAADLLKDGNADAQRAADLLTADTPPPAAELEAIVLAPRQKCLLCAALGQRFPADSTRFFALAQKLNFTQPFPFHLVRKATTHPAPIAAAR
jgi:tetratricopeptide (TPR) repeat protein